MKIKLYFQGKAVGEYDDEPMIEAFRRRLASFSPREILEALEAEEKK